MPTIEQKFLIRDNKSGNLLDKNGQFTRNGAPRLADRWMSDTREEAEAKMQEIKAENATVISLPVVVFPQA